MKASLIEPPGATIGHTLSSLSMIQSSTYGSLEATDSLLGEITPAMAVAIGQSRAMKLLLPVSHCNNQVIGVKRLTINEMVKETVERLKELL